MTVLALPPQQQSGTGQAPAKGVNVLVDSATVQRIAGDGGSGSLVTLVVPSGSANQLAGLAAEGRIALVGTGGS